MLATIADYFENKKGLEHYLHLFLEEVMPARNLLDEVGPEETLFKGELSPDAHIFKLKKNSHILAARVYISQQIILGSDKYRIQLKLYFGELLRSRLRAQGHKILIKFNHPNMVAEVGLRLTGD